VKRCDKNLIPDDNFSFIAGYTSGGAAFGVPREEKENLFRFGQIDPEDVEDRRA
jgi:hypothetical protein